MNQIKVTGKQSGKLNSTTFASVFLVIFLVLSLWMIFEYADKERQRDLMNWQSRLALLAEIRAASVEDHIREKKQQLTELSNNPTLRLFLSQDEKIEKEDPTIVLAQQGHVRNLLRASADRFGLGTQQTGQLSASKVANYGIAILGKNQQLVMATPGFTSLLVNLEEAISNVYHTASGRIIDIFKGYEQQPVYGYIMPVFHIQDMQGGTPVGAIIVLLDPQESLYKLLLNRQSATVSDETLLVKKQQASLIYMSPLSGGYQLFHQMSLTNNQLAAVYAANNEGGFTQLKDYHGNEVLLTGRMVKQTDWVLVQKIDAAEALAESNRHQKFLLTTFIILALFIAAAFIAIWRHSTSLRLQRLSQQLETHSALLDAVTGSIQDNVILVNKTGDILFINPAFANVLNVKADEVNGMQLTSVLGAQTASTIIQASEEDQLATREIEINGNRRCYHVAAISPETGDHREARLYVLHDITELKQEQQKREQLGKGIISTLVKAVDLHDPFCANHSERTREVAIEIAREMGVEGEQLDTLEMAALLANIGKLFVPKEILVKMEPLTDDESKQLRKHIEYALDILADLSFNGPVLDIIAQKNERLDGSGYPKGLKSGEILLESSILAVANAFVAMASSRAYRKGREVKEVVDILLQQTDTKYDRHVVAALFHIAENKADWKSWQFVSNK